MEVKEPDFSYVGYSYADYLSWTIDERVELIKGRVFRMSPAPRKIHQVVSRELSGRLFNFLQGKTCQLFTAPFDVRLPKASKRDEDISTVVQPDICVVCDEAKLDDLGCIGAPDLVVEILSPGNNRKELKFKYEVYEDAGVREYWIVHPEEQTILIYTLINSKFKPSRLFTSGDELESAVLPGFILDPGDIFREN